MKNKKIKRIILHIDMDYFFAQIEERENPHFQGKPVVVGADPKEGKGRGVVSTCNYKAREYGIKSGMPISRAYKLCKEAVFLPVNMSLYKRVSFSVFQIIKKKFKEIERVSVDEVYIDITKEAKSFKKAEIMGVSIKKEIYQKESLTCSVGIGENKMIAKIACEIAKPNGIKVIRPSLSKKVISAMDADVIPGIGPKTKKIIEDYLNKENLKVKDAYKISKRELLELLGKKGGEFYYKLRGVDNSPIQSTRSVKSVGREHTFQKDTRNPEKITKVFKKMVLEVAKEAQNKKLKIKGVTVVCRFEDFETHTRQKTFPIGDYNVDFLYKKSVPLLLKFLIESNKKIRLIGFRLAVFQEK
jgi:DNA polymerase IV (archaeal DinB-like DNA polymerase)